MKNYIIGLVLSITGMFLIGTVSFASDGPPTSKVSEIGDYDITADYSVDFSNVLPAPEATINGMCNVEHRTTEDYLPKHTKDFALHSLFDWEPDSWISYRSYNEWLQKKYELNFTCYSQPVIDRLERHTRLDC